MSPAGAPFVRASVDRLALGPADHLVVVPAGLATKAELLGLLAAGLRLPSWFGANWDALYDALSDLSHLGAARVVIAHEDLPLRDPSERRTYVGLLRDALARWRGAPGVRLVVAFPERGATKR